MVEEFGFLFDGDEFLVDEAIIEGFAWLNWRCVGGG